MKVLMFSLFLMFGISQACDYSACDSINPISEFFEVGFLPNKEQLLKLCPKTLQYFVCENRNVKTCTGKSIQELSLLDDQDAKQFRMFLKLEKIVLEVCNENSTLHKDYVDTIECFRDFLRKPNTVCEKETPKAEEKILEILNNIGDSHELYLKKRCLEAAFEAACFTLQLEETCGEAARTTAITLLQMLKGVWGSEECTGLENGGAELKARFLDALGLDESRKSKFQIAFDLVRKRR
ncbi:uncharacterized protein CEXT_112501 [Caerostris extrusa]|uniref:Uncharacterized protein n=1 Tax=Caerostris extrusa TaxID=172846 RepID=A0AAV4X3F0_CAEEX|nr:uncharacterized protein CEXT_112501 [Caerostris extrusa]